jgi:hypothetical protein
MSEPSAEVTMSCPIGGVSDHPWRRHRLFPICCEYRCYADREGHRE